MYRVTKQFEFQAAHVLSKHAGLCRFPHGHNYKVEVTLVADKLDQNNMVCDFQALKIILSECLDQLDHSILLNSTDSASRKSQENNPRCHVFDDRDPTSEVLAETIFKFVQDRLTRRIARSSTGIEFTINPSVTLEKVRIWETSTAWAEYQP
jgi:6-pyruvoyltetrahydropterin/6-carboxytetrahydropterin synthase